MVERNARRHRRISRLVAATTVAAGALTYLGYKEQLRPVTDRSPIAESHTLSSDTFSVLTANVHGWESVGDDPIAPALEVIVLDNRPDAICLQEDKKNADEFHDFLSEEGYTAYFSPTTFYPWRDVDGNTLAVRHDSSLEDVVQFPDSRRNMLDVEIPHDSGVSVNVLCGHLAYLKARQEPQIATIEHHVEQVPEENTVILVGDFNIRPKTLRELQLSGFGSLKFPSTLHTFDPDRDGDGPLIDYVLPEQPEAKVVLRETFSINSDHKALYVDLELTDIIGHEVLGTDSPLLSAADAVGGNHSTDS